jgi:NADH dehydrogenase FAD-containing subunit
MVPGLIEGRYTLDQLSFDLVALARAARARFLEDTVTRIDAHAHTVTLASGRSLEYDVASVAIGGRPAAASIPGAAAHARFVTPIDRLAALIPAMEAAAQSAGPEPLQVVVVGAGATGVEIALTTRARLDQLGATRAIITLLDSANTLVRQTGAAIAETAERELRHGEITLRLSTGVEEIGPGHLRLTGGRILSADLILCCGGIDAPTLFRDSALPVDGHGFLTVQDTLAVPGVAGRERFANLGWALLIAVFFHIFLLALLVKFTYALQLGDWSLEHFGAFARNAYGLLTQLMDLPFKFALPLILWVAFYIRRVPRAG